MRVELNDPSLEKGKELYVNNLGVLINGKSVEFSEEDIKLFEKKIGFKTVHKGKTYSCWFPKQDFNQGGKGLEFKG